MWLLISGAIGSATLAAGFGFSPGLYVSEVILIASLWAASIWFGSKASDPKTDHLSSQERGKLNRLIYDGEVLDAEHAIIPDIWNENAEAWTHKSVPDFLESIGDMLALEKLRTLSGWESKDRTFLNRRWIEHALKLLKEVRDHGKPRAVLSVALTKSERAEARTMPLTDVQASVVEKLAAMRSLRSNVRGYYVNEGHNRELLVHVLMYFYRARWSVRRDRKPGTYTPTSDTRTGIVIVSRNADQIVEALSWVFMDTKARSMTANKHGTRVFVVMLPSLP